MASATLIVLLLAATALRVMSMVAYRPALFFSDSWGYLVTAFTGHPISISYLRPEGYAVLIRLLTFPGRDLDELVALQHLSGLVAGGLIYLVLVRSAAPRTLALAGAAVVLLDGYRIALEQYVMPESFFTVTLLVSALLLVPSFTTSAGRSKTAPPPRPTSDATAPPPRPHLLAAALAGLLLAASIIQREAALFAIPAFLVYLAWARVGARIVIAFLLALAVPVLGYAGIYKAKMGTFALTESDGWNLYGRVAGFANCPADGIPPPERALCETSGQRARHPVAGTWYIWDGDSRANRLFHNGHRTRQVQEHANQVLGAFARRVIVHQPFQYLDAAGSDFGRYFEPGATAFGDSISATSLPKAAAEEAGSERVRRRVLPHMHPEVTQPGPVLRAYRSVFHVPRPVLALLTLVSLIALVLRTPARRQVLLMSGTGLLMLLGTAGTAGFGLRYLMPSVPFLAIGGGLALTDLIRRVRPSRSLSRPR